MGSWNWSLHVQARDWYTCKYERGALYGKMHEVYNYYVRERGRERESKEKQVTKPINNLLWNKINELYTFQEK